MIFVSSKGYFRDTMGNYDGLLHLMGLSMAVCGVGWIIVNLYEKCVASAAVRWRNNEDSEEGRGQNNENGQRETESRPVNNVVHTEIPEKQQYITKL